MIENQSASSVAWNARPRTTFGELAVIRAGEGITILLLHGVGLQSEAWNGQIDALAQHCSVLAPDMPGHGKSPPPQGEVTIATYTKQIVEVLELTASGPLIAVGHSMGAMIAHDLASRYPERLLGLVALNAIYRRTPNAAAAVRKRADELDGCSVADPSGPLRRWFKDEGSPEALACSGWLTEVSPVGYKAAYTVFAHSEGPTAEDLKALSCPALFMTGADDPNSTPAMSEAMAALVPDGRSIVLTGAAHMMPMTHLGEVNAEMLSFIAQCLR